MAFIVADNDRDRTRDHENNDGGGISNDRAKPWQRRYSRRSRDSSTKIEPLAPTASLMQLPTELRIEIFEYVFDNRAPITLFNGSNIIVLVNSAGEDQVDSKADGQPTALLRVCRQIHTEATDVFFNRALFGIIASPYEQPPRSSGIEKMQSLPNGSIAVSILQQVRRVLLVMSLRGNAFEGHGYRMGSLTWLQAMTSLKEIRLVFTLQDGFRFSNEQMAPIRAIAESVPGSARIFFGPQFPLENSEVDASQDIAELSFVTDPSRQSLAINSAAGRKLLYARAQQHLDEIVERRGILSGSVTDHSRCWFENCIDGAGCVNSTMKTPPLKKRGPVSKILHALAPRGEASSMRGLRM